MIKNVVMSQNIPNNGKLQKRSNWTSKRAKWWVTSQIIQNYAKHESDHIKWICTDLTSKRSKMLSYVAKHSKQKLNYNELHRYNVKMIKNVVMSQNIQTTENYKSDQIIMNCIDLTSKRSKMLSYVANHSKPLNYKSDQNTMTFTDLMSKTSKQLKTTKVIKLRWICIDLTSKRSKMLSYVANHSKPLNYESDQNTMTCIDLTSKVIT